MKGASELERVCPCACITWTASVNVFLTVIQSKNVEDIKGSRCSKYKQVQEEVKEEYRLMCISTFVAV